jgi:hypothetical protein
MGEWHDACLELPGENAGEVLVIVNGGYKNVYYVYSAMIAEYVAGEGWIIDGREDWEDANVLYWMEVPELPKQLQDRIKELMQRTEGGR